MLWSVVERRSFGCSLVEWGKIHLTSWLISLSNGFFWGFWVYRLTHATIFRSVDVVVGDQETEVEGEVDQGPEHGLPNNKHKAPDVIGDVVDVFQGTWYEAAIEEEPGELLEIEEEAADDVENVDQGQSQKQAPPLGVLIWIIDVPEERWPEDAEGEKEAEGEAEEEGGEDGEGDQHGVHIKRATLLLEAAIHVLEDSRIISGWNWEKERNADDTDGQAKVDPALVLQLCRHPGELERDVDGEDDQAEWGKEVVEGEEEGVEGAIGGGLLPVVVDVVLDEEGGDEAAI